MAVGESRWREKSMIETERGIGGMVDKCKELDFILSKMKNHWWMLNK